MPLHDYMERYEAQIPVIGINGQNKLRHTRVLIVGLGGIGSHVAFFLATLGVCEIAAIDPQKLELANMNRWPYGSEVDVGLMKVRAAAQRFALEPQIGFRGLASKAESEESNQFFSECDFVFSCANTITGRIAAARKAIHLKKPIIDLAIGDTRKPPRGVIKYWLPENASWSACPECYLTSKIATPKDNGLLFTPVAVVASIGVHIFLSLALGYHDQVLRSHNLLCVDLAQQQTAMFAVRRRTKCTGCRR